MRNHFLPCVVVSCLIVSCGKTETSSGKSSTVRSINDAPIYMEKIQNSEVDVTSLKTILPSEVVNIIKLKEGVLSSYLEDLLIQSESMIGTKALKAALRTAYMIDGKDLFSGKTFSSLDKESRKKFTDELATYVSDLPERLNTFPTVSLKLVQDFQNELVESKVKSDAKISDLAPYMPGAKAPTKLEFVLKGSMEVCDQPKKDTFRKIEKPYLEKEIFFEGSERLSSNISSCYFENSRELSLAVNTLANVLSDQAQSIDLKYVNGDYSENYAVHDINVLLSVLGNLGHRAETFLKRGFVNFKAYSIKIDGERRYMRSPLWISSRVDSKVVLLPAEHADYSFALIDTETDDRVAGIRYFLGVPEKETSSQVSFWRPAEFKESGWVRGKVSNIKSYGSENLYEAEKWFLASFDTMWGFQKFQKREKLPYNGYGINVCTDSVVLAYTKYLELTENTNLENRDFQTYFISRATAKDLNKKLYADVGVKEDFIEKMFPSDVSLLSRDKEAYFSRVKQSIGEDPARYRIFPEASIYIDEQ